MRISTATETCWWWKVRDKNEFYNIAFLVLLRELEQSFNVWLWHIRSSCKQFAGIIQNHVNTNICIMQMRKNLDIRHTKLNFMVVNFFSIGVTKVLF